MNFESYDTHVTSSVDFIITNVSLSVLLCGDEYNVSNYMLVLSVAGTWIYLLVKLAKV